MEVESNTVPTVLLEQVAMAIGLVHLSIQQIAKCTGLSEKSLLEKVSKLVINI